MNTSFHFNLIKEEEMLSPSPVRLRVMLPVLSLLLVAALAVWWMLALTRTHAANQKLMAVKIDIDSLRLSHQTILALRAEEKELAASLRQMGFYTNSLVRFSEALCRLPEHVPADIQITELYVPQPAPPPAPPPKPGVPAATAPTSTFERVSLRLAGRAGGGAPADAINSLLADLRKPAFASLIVRASVPPGAFRQEVARGTGNHNTLLFEIQCECSPRRFE
jgi:hypothetical protein